LSNNRLVELHRLCPAAVASRNTTVIHIKHSSSHTHMVS